MGDHLLNPGFMAFGFHTHQPFSSCCQSYLEDASRVTPSAGTEALLWDMDPIEADFFAQASKCDGASHDNTMAPVFQSSASTPAKATVRPTMKRTRFGRKQLEVLNGWFKSHLNDPYPSEDDMQTLSASAKLSGAQVRTWFTNTRARRTRQEQPARTLEHSPSSPLEADKAFTQTRSSLTSDSLGKLSADSQAASTVSMERYVHQLEEYDSTTMDAIKTAAAAMPKQQDPISRDSSANSMRPARSAVSSRAGSHRTVASNGSRTSASSMAFSVMSRTSGIHKPGRKGKRRWHRTASASSIQTRPPGDALWQAVNNARSPSPEHDTSPKGDNDWQYLPKLARRALLDQADTEHSYIPQRAPPQPPIRYSCTTCDKAFKELYEWKRHEATHFRGMEGWTCMPGNRFAADDDLCTFCGEPVTVSHLEQHRILDCQQKEECERFFVRKDHLKQHMRHVHGLTKDQLRQPRLDKAIAKWRQFAPRENIDITALWCGFCKTFLPDWTCRLDHVAEHFRNGYCMATWRSVGWECENFRDNCGLTIRELARTCSLLGCDAGVAYSHGFGPGLHLTTVHGFGVCGGIIFTDAWSFREHLKELHHVDFPGLNDMLCETALFDA